MVKKAVSAKREEITVHRSRSGGRSYITIDSQPNVYDSIKVSNKFSRKLRAAGYVAHSQGNGCFTTNAPVSELVMILPVTAAIGVEIR